MTNRDLYLAIGEFGSRYGSDSRSLEEYLLALLRLVEPFKNQVGLSPAEFLRVLSDAFAATPAPFDGGWLADCDAFRLEHFDSKQEIGYQQWRGTLIQQIVDLHEMAEKGFLKDEHRYFGIDSPRGGRWYNFDPVTYLECGMVGSLGGWEPDDDTGREFVPGECVVMDSNGNLQSANPQEIERPIFELTCVTWSLFTGFLMYGQMYE